MNDKNVVIIGGGLGGLFTGALLAKEGYRVTVLEKNAAIGGGLQTFRRMGEDFDTGMHVIAGMRPGGTIRRICDYLGITPQMQLRDVDDDCADELFFLEDRATYRIGCGRQGFVDSLQKSFPGCHDELTAYVNALYRMTDAIDLFNLRPTPSVLTEMPPQALMAADAFIAQYVHDPKLRSVLAYMNPLYGGQAGHTPAYVHAIVSVLYLQGATRFVDGSSHTADLLAKVITDHGGQVLAHDAVTAIDVENHEVKAVTTRSGKIYHAATFISDIHPTALVQLIHGKAFTKAYTERVKQIPETISAFSLYLKMRPGSFPYINHSVYLMSHYDDIWNFSREDRPWPLGLLMMTPPVSRQQPWSSKVLVTVPMRFSQAEHWADTLTGRRGDDYEQWKQQRAREVLAMVEQRYPGFSGNIEGMVTASPLTIRDYYGTAGGGIAGFARDCHQILDSHLPVMTKVRNLLLTGQFVNLHGFCGVPLSAINTSEALSGLNTVVNKINDYATKC